MPHEHVNSSLVDATLDRTAADPDHPNGVMRVPERITVIWNRPAAPHAYADPEDGYVQIVSENLGSQARFPTPEIIEIDLDSHVYVPDPDEDGERCASPYCGNPRAHALHVDAPASERWLDRHRFVPRATPDPDPDQDTCAFPNCGKLRRADVHNDRLYRKVKTEGKPTWSEPCTGIAVTLTRGDLNRLIKMLRRARDEAYGADA